MVKYNINEILKAANEAVMPTQIKANSGSSKLSFGIVNSKSNGKRLTISKSLASVLELGDEVKMIPLPDQAILLVGKNVPNPSPIFGKLRDCDGKKICYSSSAVTGITDIFHLTFGPHTSQSFDDIALDTYENCPIALIHIVDMYAGEAND